MLKNLYNKTMATYVCSDLHGQYHLFEKLLKEINFSQADSLYVLGDIIDKGDKSLALIDFIRKQPNMHCILGNHEQAFLQYYNSVMQSEDEFNEEEILSKLQRYFPYDDNKITWDIIDYLESLPYYIETNEFIGVHAGLLLDKNNTIYPLEQQSINNMLYDRAFKSAKINNPFNKPILFGHTPCHYDNGTGRFIKEPDIMSANIRDYIKIRLDNGSQFTNMLGVLRVDDMKEIYTTEV